MIDSAVLQHLLAIRRQVDEIVDKVDGLEGRVGGMADADQVARLGLKLDGLTHVVASGFKAIVDRLDSLDKRLRDCSASPFEQS